MYKNTSIEMGYNIKYIYTFIGNIETIWIYEYTTKYYVSNIKIETGKLLNQGYENKIKP